MVCIIIFRGLCMSEFFRELIFDILPHSLEETIFILPLLFLTYLFMEYLEHKTGDKLIEFVKKSTKVGPLIGATTGIVPQCGFSAMASSLYSGRVITLGTLIAVFLSTSDEMIPIMISRQVPVSNLIVVIITKLILGALGGFILDLIFRAKRNDDSICVEEMCEHEHCNCEKGIFPSALRHTLSVYIYIFIIILALNLIIHNVGDEAIASLVITKPVVGQLICGLIGIIPSCASSVVITELFLNDVISAGAMMSGLLVGSGVGILVLFRTNKHLKENILILVTLYAMGIIFGIVLDILNFGVLLK